MKKLFLILCVLFMFALSASASGAYDDVTSQVSAMPAIVAILLFILLTIWGLFWPIMTIILFFKIWGITNDVRALKRHICGY